MPNAREIRSLLVKFEGQSAQFNSEAGKAARSMDRAAKTIDTRANQAAKAFEKMGERVRSVGAGLVAALTFDAAIKGLQAMVAELDAIGKQAATVGVSAEFLQAFAFQAGQAGVTVGDLESGVFDLAKNLGELRAGEGSLFAFLEKNNAELGRQLALTTDTEQAIKLLADEFRGMSNETDRAALANKAFGGAGKTMVRVMKEGSAAIDEQRQLAEELGVVIDGRVIRNMEALQNRMDVASDVMRKNLMQAFYDLSPVIVTATEGVAAMARGLSMLVDEMREVSDMSDAGINRQFEEANADMTRLIEERDKLATQFFDLRAIDGEDAPAVMVLKGQLRALNTEIQETEARMGSLLMVANDRNAENKTAVPGIPDPQVTRAALEVNKEILGEWETTVKETGRGAQDYLQEMANEWTVSVKTAAEENREALAEYENFFTNELTGAMDEFVDTGKLKMDEFVADMLRGLAKIAAKKAALAALDGAFSAVTGTPAGTFGTGAGGFQGFFANGGKFQANRPMVVGEKGPELIVPRTGGTVIPNGGGNSGGVSITQINHIDARGAQRGVSGDIAGAMRVSQDRIARDIAAQQAARARRFPGG